MPKIVDPKQMDYLCKLRKEEDPLILEMEVFAKSEKIPILDWKSVEFIEQIVFIQKPKRVLEIGTAIAYTSIRIAKCLIGECIIDTIEKSKDNVTLAKNFIKRSGVGSKINLIEGDAFDILPKLKFKYDLIFLDADKGDYQELFDLSMKLLKKDGLIIIDNLLWYGFAASSRVQRKYKTSTKHIRLFNENFVLHPELKVTILPFGDGIGFGIKLK
ncbi:MAG: methyltransferase [Ignavibacteria bacterium RBG_13_36_8]|nr:MAG: methyltransferase [Ignavibacteria bacterium RBG_13_36_8]